MKISKMKYGKNTFVYHPETVEQFRALQQVLIDCKNNDDINGVYITALQLIPDEVE